MQKLFNKFEHGDTFYFQDNSWDKRRLYLVDKEKGVWQLVFDYRFDKRDFDKNNGSGEFTEETVSLNDNVITCKGWMKYTFLEKGEKVEPNLFGYKDGDVFEAVDLINGKRTLKYIKDGVWDMVDSGGETCWSDGEHVGHLLEIEGGIKRYSCEYKFVNRKDHKMEEQNDNTVRYYKIVNHDLTSGFRNKESIQYKVGEYVYPKSGTYLFVFDTLEKAKSFAKNSHVIYECECECVCQKTPEFFKGRSVPTGTVYAYGVKLIDLAEKPKYTPVVGRKWFAFNVKSGVTEICTETEKFTLDRNGWPCHYIDKDTGEILGNIEYKVGKVVKDWYFTNNEEEFNGLVSSWKILNQK